MPHYHFYIEQTQIGEAIKFCGVGKSVKLSGDGIIKLPEDYFLDHTYLILVDEIIDVVNDNVKGIKFNKEIPVKLKSLTKVD